MSGPQGSDPTQAWSGQPPQSGGAPSPGEQPAWQPPPTPEQPAGDAPAWQQPAYQQPQPPQQYPQYQQPAYNPPPQGDQYGQQPTAYAPQGYPQYGQQQPGQPYGQPPNGQPQQPYGQPGQYDQQQYSPYGPTGTEEGSKKSLAVIGTVVGLLAAVIVAVVLVLGFWKPGFFVTTTLDVDAAQTGVQQILTDEANGYGATNVKDVQCNDGVSPVVKKGDTFTCQVSIDGTKRQVTVTFQDDNGTYEVGRPK
ncbi:DUF4333 domain-containing protein [Mycolicibacterium frederiksbergense]|uniref:DUF4333 domain-containing protein n=1 Tax=Mycolicibacterium frederiksbergense TaxID=117567 RepID=UPI00265BF10D|nr:DUF4333 domain-containing protein [Mycolicibacterium frederiksbergense]MDO0976730.1 DUF4333 domain-containing protein [Mycolicibacterium frederiksbergense]